MSPATLIKDPLIKQDQSGNPVLASPRSKMSSVLTRSFDFQSSRMVIPAERKMKKAMNGHPLTIRSRIPTEIHAATISVAQIEFAASKNRQEVTKLDENEADAATEIRL